MIHSNVKIKQNHDIAGFVAKNVKKGEKNVHVIYKGMYISDQPEFYNYIEKLSNIFLPKLNVMVNSVCRFLVIIHKDLTADIYVNDFPVILSIKAKRNIEKGQLVSINDIADIGQIKFGDISIKADDKIMYCFKVGWKFGLYFNLDNKRQLDVDKCMLEIGALYRYLHFQHLYKVLENDTEFDELLKDGWFPFIDIIGDEYKELSKIYKDKFDFENKTLNIVDKFDSTRINKISDKWWSNELFNSKKSLISAGIDAYFQNDKNGFINCIKNLTSEIEGITRLHYFGETNKSKPKFSELVKHIIEKAKEKSGSDDSLLLPMHFLRYLDEIFFADFDLSDNKVTLSRHSSSHGVAKEDDFHKIKALQTILTLDQVYFYIN